MLRVSTLALVLLCATCSAHPFRGGADAAGRTSDGAAAGDARTPDTLSNSGSGDTSVADSENRMPAPDLAYDVAAADREAVPLDDATGGAPACVANPQPPPDIPSRQTVRFHFQSSSSGYLVSQGSECLPFLIERHRDGSTTPIILGSYRTFMCEAPSAPPIFPANAIALGHPGGAMLTWDARQLEPHQVCVDCEARGWPEIRSYPLTMYTRVPVDPGRYRATFTVIDPLPISCAAEAGMATCGVPPVPGAPSPEPPMQLCPGSRTFSVDFELPAIPDLDSAAGDVDVMVEDSG
jgi:hypothetical protein